MFGRSNRTCFSSYRLFDDITFMSEQKDRSSMLPEGFEIHYIHNRVKGLYLHSL